MATLLLQDGTAFTGTSFGAAVDTDGEVVFSTGMTGYTESMTDPSFRGQILTFTYPLIGNYGVPSERKNAWGFSENFESEDVQVRGVVVAQESREFKHFAAVSSLHEWMAHHGIPGISGIDTRALTKKLREHGVMLGRIVQDDSALTADRSSLTSSIEDPNLRNLVAEVSITEPVTYEPAEKPEHATSIVAFDCGMKRNIIRSWLRRGVTVHRVPWNYDLSSSSLHYDGVFISNGPGDPKMCKETIAQITWAIDKGIPTFGICLGNQLLALAIGADTYKLKYGHRGVNQPCVEEGAEDAKETEETKGTKETKETEETGEGGVRCIITSQNHGFAVSEELPQGWRVWFRNANDGTVEGIRHTSGKFFSVQFHPEASPGPEDAGYLFDEFLQNL